MTRRGGSAAVRAVGVVVAFVAAVLLWQRGVTSTPTTETVRLPADAGGSTTFEWTLTQLSGPWVAGAVVAAAVGVHLLLRLRRRVASSPRP
ncbi:hypothetical protein [Rhodococcoides kroppenstedtii]|uniref:hypothetical protein n=1 Tax=Rhodococcoides kroppenstedtii TaxID=293050 RepID=UPI001427C088|nr:hypothetical protein [Rhodococcus kroppenstedtii]